MNRGTPRPSGGFYTPNNRQQAQPIDQRNTVNIPFYRDTSGDNRNFGNPSTPQNYHFQRNNHHHRGGGGGGGRGGYHDNRRFNHNNSFTPRHNRPPHHQQQNVHRSRENVDISQFYHPSMLEDPWKDLMNDESERETARREHNAPA